MRRLFGFIAVILLLAWGGPVVAADHPLKGVALVIGQSDYEGATLPRLANPKNDARAIDNLLEDLGFDVTRVLDGDGKKLKQEIADFTHAAKDADVALIYYSGHGIEAGGENYLAPVDADLSTPQRAGQTLIPLTPLLDELGKAVPVTIVLLDACRTNAFAAGTMIQPPGAAVPVPAVENGLAVVRGVMPVAKPGVPADNLGMVIGFAAAPGEPALDGDPGDENSPYAAALLKHFGAGGYSLADVMTMVGEEVYLKTRAQQMPWVNSSLRRVLNFGTPVEDPDPDERAIKDGRRKLLLSIATEPDATRATVETIAASQDVPLDALYGMLKVLGVDTSSGAADLEKQLEEGAKQLKQFKEQDLGTAAIDPELKRLSELAQRAQDEGAMDLALKYREQATARARDLSAERDALEQGLKADRIEIAKTFADHAQTAALNFDYDTAAKMFGEAYGQVAKWDDNLALTYKRDEAEQLWNAGYFLVDNQSLVAAIAAFGDALTLAPQDKRPADRAALQGELGATHFSLGERQGDPVELKAAVAALQLALGGGGLPAADWPRMQMFLGNALVLLAQHGDPTGLPAARDALAKALDSARAQADPYAIGSIEADLAATLRLIADTEIGTATAEQSIAMFRNALNDLDRSKWPFDWARTQNNYATALILLAARTKDEAPLKEAETALAAALTVQREDVYPLDWALAEANLGNVYMTYYSLPQNNDVGRLQQALEAFRTSLRQLPRDSVPVFWSTAQQNIGNALAKLSGATGNRGTMEQAVAALRLALSARAESADPVGFAELEIDLSRALWGLGHDEVSPDRLNDAVTAARAGLRHLTAEGQPILWGKANMALGDALQALGARSIGGADTSFEASAAYAAAAKVVSPQADPLTYALAVEGVGEIEAAGDDVDGLGRAIALYGDALKKLDQAAAPLAWLTLQTNLAQAYVFRGVKTGDVADLRTGRSLLAAAQPVAATQDADTGDKITAFLKTLDGRIAEDSPSSAAAE